MTNVSFFTINQKDTNDNLFSAITLSTQLYFEMEKLFNKIKSNIEKSNNKKIECVRLEGNKLIHNRNICHEDLNSGVCSIFIGCFIIEAKKRFKEKQDINNHIDIIELL